MRRLTTRWKIHNGLTRARFVHVIPPRLSLLSSLLLPSLGKFFQLGRGIVERDAQVRGSLDC